MTPFDTRQRRQTGAVAIVFGLTLIVMLAMGGLVLDLGHLYVVKAELQNAADGAALAGAKELNESASGIIAAADQATKIAALNNFNFSTVVSLASTNITFGTSPDGPWLISSDAQSSPQGQTFIKVDTGAKTLSTYLMQVVGLSTISTSGVAVAGRFVNDITPIGVCAVDPANKTAKYTYSSGLTELVEYGFRRGVSYNLFGLNPLPGQSDPYLINPVDAPPATCVASHSSASFTAPFMCMGSSAVIATGSGKVYTNSGATASLDSSLNSRFDDYKSPSVCDPATAPPDTNIKQYPCRGNTTGCITNASGDISVTPAINWMDPAANVLPSQQSISLDPSTNQPLYRLPSATAQTPLPASAPYGTSVEVDQYGALWSYGPAYKATSATTPLAGAAFTPAEANVNTLYSRQVTAPASAAIYFDITGADKYPTSAGSGFPSGTPASPYNQTSGTYFQAPSAAHPGVRNRRLLSAILIDCRVAPSGPASCGTMTAVGIGRFFMTTKANFSGGPGKRHLDVEFAGLIEPVPNSEIKLYR
jgi:Flp pilus assembly protein TadG